MADPWTRPSEVRARLGKKWQSGLLLRAFAEGRDWEPLSVALHGPAVAEIPVRLAEVQQWAAGWARAARGPVRVEYKQVGGRRFGANTILCRAWVDGYDQAWDLLGVRAEVCTFSPWPTRRPDAAPGSSRGWRAARCRS